MNVRVLHDGGWIHPGGGSRVAVEIAKAFGAPITVGHTECPDWWRNQPVDVDIAFNHELHDSLPARLIDRPALRPAAELRLGQCFRTLDINEDVVISSGTPAKWWVPRHDQTHVHYCHVPPPRLYGEPDSGLIEWGMKTPVRMLDHHHAQFVDRFVANSPFTADRVRTHYQRDPVVVNPPVRVSDFEWRPPTASRYLVHIGRLTDMKRVQLIAEAMQHVQSDVHLVMVGDGPHRDTCAAVENVSVYGNISDYAVEQTVARSLGGIAFARHEHCGITPKEYQAAGKPVVVPDEPNLNNHVTDGETGLIAPVSADALASTIDDLVSRDWDRTEIAAAAKTWSRPHFRTSMREVVADATATTESAVEEPPMPAVPDGGT